ncbi:MAG: hypothetical protein KAV87_49755 [Desulfobacteraceae bacterium]|nr:hypothetical protein [Desulfobacteraceae bacterium]
MKLYGSELLVKVMEANEVRYIFGVPGGHLLKFYDSLYYSKQITPILTKHESGASRLWQLATPRSMAVNLLPRIGM